jgi:hypothetical protein
MALQAGHCEECMWTWCMQMVSYHNTTQYHNPKDLILNYMLSYIIKLINNVYRCHDVSILHTDHVIILHFPKTHLNHICMLFEDLLLHGSFKPYSEYHYCCDI